MLALLRRDYKLLFAKRDEGYFILVFIPLILLLFGDKISDGIYFMLIYSCTILISAMPFTYKNRLKVNMFIQSLPISRSKIVITRYISLIVNFIFVRLYTWALVKIFELFGADYQMEGFGDIITKDAFFVVCIISAVIFPMLFCIKNTTFANILIVISVSTSGLWILMIMEWIYGSGLSSISMLLCVLGMLVISMMISLWIYNHKDLG